MTTIYVVTSGRYSDYQVDAMFSTQEQAEKYIKRRKELKWGYEECNGVEEWELDSISADWLDGKLDCWVVHLGYDTADVQMTEISEYEAQENICWYPATSAYPKRIRIAVYADTQERAVKVAMERRSVWLANEGAP